MASQSLPLLGQSSKVTCEKAIVFLGITVAHHSTSWAAISNNPFFERHGLLSNLTHHPGVFCILLYLKMFQSTLVIVAEMRKSLSHDLYGPVMGDQRDLECFCGRLGGETTSEFKWALPNAWEYVCNTNLNIILKKEVKECQTE